MLKHVATPPSGLCFTGLDLKMCEIVHAIQEFELAYPTHAHVPVEDMLRGDGDVKCTHRRLGDDTVVTITVNSRRIEFMRWF